MRDIEEGILFNAIGCILDNQFEIMKKLEIIDKDCLTSSGESFIETNTEIYRDECFSIAMGLEDE